MSQNNSSDDLYKIITIMFGNVTSSMSNNFAANPALTCTHVTRLHDAFPYISQTHLTTTALARMYHFKKMSNVFAYFHRGCRVIKMVYLQYVCLENGRFLWFVTFVKEWLRACVIPEASQKRKLTHFS